MRFLLLSLFTLALVWGPAWAQSVSGLRLRFPIRVAEFPANYTLWTPGDRTTDRDVWSDVDGLVRPMYAGVTYAFHCRGSYVTQGGAVAMQLSITGPANPTTLRYQVHIRPSSPGVHGASQNAYDTVTNPGTGPGPSIKVPWAITGVIVAGASNGVFMVRFRTEVDNQFVTIHKGGSCIFY